MLSRGGGSTAVGGSRRGGVTADRCNAPTSPHQGRVFGLTLETLQADKCRIPGESRAGHKGQSSDPGAELTMQVADRPGDISILTHIFVSDSRTQSDSAI